MIDRVYTLPSGTELDVQSAIGDIRRAINTLTNVRDVRLDDELDSQKFDSAISDLSHVGELLKLLSTSESIHALYAKVREHPDYVFGTIFVRGDFDDRDLLINGEPAWNEFHDSNHAEAYLVEAGWTYIVNGVAS